ncbi:MAG: ferrous iron transport protein A [Methanomicrobium sp.]|nr:ferrous iron transport protein A [Methanomicrobium sp.]MBO4522324.1 ferrous iron transport protein A [Methanomicrobium sp.]MBR6012127.1 ferrous iron transport protein A [Methanomicrobium sp.]
MTTSDIGESKGQKVTTLDTLPPNHKGTIIGVSGAGAFKKRILGMGIVAGTEIENVRSAPLGDPVEYKLKGYCLSLRKSEAKLIEICNVTEAD